MDIKVTPPPVEEYLDIRKAPCHTLLMDRNECIWITSNVTAIKFFPKGQIETYSVTNCGVEVRVMKTNEVVTLHN